MHLYTHIVYNVVVVVLHFWHVFRVSQARERVSKNVHFPENTQHRIK